MTPLRETPEWAEIYICFLLHLFILLHLFLSLLARRVSQWKDF